MNWLSCSATGIEVSATAAKISRLAYPFPVYNEDIFRFLLISIDYDVYLFREILWYILPDWKEICDILATKHGAMVIVELSFYDDQHYGRDYFDGPDEFIRKWPFTIEKIVREHTTKNKREGRLMIAGKVT